jgi:hypothetical protein
MALYSPQTLNRIQKAVMRTLTDTCAIEALTRVDDGAGGFTSSWTTVTGLSSVPCRKVSPKVGDEKLVESKINGRMLSTFQFLPSVPITKDHRIMYKSVQYEVLGIKGPVTDQMILPVLVAEAPL